ncbi:MAG: class I SAM-dependent methyltransferase [Thermocladium sp.]|jgi:SAM-dependent methyltransferase
MNSLKLLGRIAWIYSTLISIPIRGLHELVIRNIPDRSSVLDIGCGPGLLDVELQLRDNKVTCVDALIPMAKISMRRGIDVAVGSIEMLPLRASSFDVAITTLVMHQVKNRGKAISEVMTALKPGGYWVAAEFIKRTLINWAFMDYGPFQHPGKIISKWRFGVAILLIRRATNPC